MLSAPSKQRRAMHSTTTPAGSARCSPRNLSLSSDSELEEDVEKQNGSSTTEIVNLHPMGFSRIDGVRSEALF